MQTKKHNKRKNKLTKQPVYSVKTCKKGGGLNDEKEGVEDEKEKTPSYKIHALLMLGLSLSYIFLKLTK